MAIILPSLIGWKGDLFHYKRNQIFESENLKTLIVVVINYSKLKKLHARLLSTSWSNCSFPAFISEVDTKHIFWVLSIPSDPFHELKKRKEEFLWIKKQHGCRALFHRSLSWGGVQVLDGKKPSFSFHVFATVMSMTRILVFFWLNFCNFFVNREKYNI